MNLSSVYRDTARHRSREPHIDTARTVAFTLLVSYHVIGLDAGGGLGLDYPHPLRIFADYLVLLRMPVFAVIAGYVYSLRPLVLSDFGGFTSGKVRRLLVPGAVAALVFAFASTLMGNEFARTPGDLWEILAYPYAHYWYLQAMMVIFVGFALVDCLLRQNHSPWLLLGACALFLSDLDAPSIFSLRAVPYLLPFFVLGVVIQRNLARFLHYRYPLIALFALVVIGATELQFITYLKTGALMEDRHSPVALAFGIAACGLLLLTLPRLGLLERLAPFAFTIYLYHIFGTSGMRQALTGLGVTATPLLFVAGLAAGIALPVAVHLLAERHWLARRLVLGLRR